MDVPDLAAASELSADDVVRQVLARNPSLAEMVAAWKAAQDRYPQVTSLDDPMFGATGSPRVSRTRTTAAIVSRSRRKSPGAASWPCTATTPWPRPAPPATTWKTCACSWWRAQDRLLRILAGGPRLEVNREAQRLLGEFRRDAADRYTKGLVPEQDIFQADVEVGQQQERQVTLERMREVAVARLNTLMHLPPDSPLPPAPVHSIAVAAIPETPALREEALARAPT